MVSTYCVAKWANLNRCPVTGQKKMKLVEFFAWQMGWSVLYSKWLFYFIPRLLETLFRTNIFRHNFEGKLKEVMLYIHLSSAETVVGDLNVKIENWGEIYTWKEARGKNCKWMGTGEVAEVGWLVRGLWSYRQHHSPNLTLRRSDYSQGCGRNPSLCGGVPIR